MTNYGRRSSIYATPPLVNANPSVYQVNGLASSPTKQRSRSKLGGMESFVRFVAYLAAAILLCLDADTVRSIPPSLFVILLFVVGGVFLWMSVAKSAKTTYKYLSVPCVLAFALFLHYSVSGVTITLWRSLPWESRWVRDKFLNSGAEANLSFACYLAILGALGLFCGSSIALRNRSRESVRDTRELERLRRFLPGLLVCTLVLLIASRFVPSVLSQTMAAMGSFSKILIALSAFAAASSRKTSVSLRWWVICGAGCLAFAVPSLLSGMRETVLKGPLLVAIGYVAARRRIPWAASLATFALFVLVLLPVLNVVKQYALRGDTSVAARLGSAAQNSKAETSGSMESVVSNLLARANLLESPAIFSQFFPDSYPYVLGETFKIELIEFAPRIFWPDKPEVGRLLDEYSRLVGIIGEDDSQTSAKFDLITEGYINFGALGVFLFCWCHGFYFRLLESGLQRFLSPLLATLIITVLILDNHDFFGFVMLASSDFKLLSFWIVIVAIVGGSIVEKKKAF